MRTRRNKLGGVVVLVMALAVLASISLMYLTGHPFDPRADWPFLAYHSEGYHMELGEKTITIDGGEEGFGSVKLDVNIHVYRDQWFCIRMERLSGPEYRWWFDIHFEGSQATTWDAGPEVYCYQIQSRDLYVKWVHVAGYGQGEAEYRPIFTVEDEPLPGSVPTWTGGW
jgi:hypothetical protein